jgi:hypothetical protein
MFEQIEDYSDLLIEYASSALMKEIDIFSRFSIDQAPFELANPRRLRNLMQQIKDSSDLLTKYASSATR